MFFVVFERHREDGMKRHEFIIAALSCVAGVCGCSDSAVGIFECVDGNCGDGCGVCEAGAWRCVPDGYQVCEERAGCMSWGEVRGCESGTRCKASARGCVAEPGGDVEPGDCGECRAGEARCELGKRVVCECDESGCLRWGEARVCDSDAYCDEASGECRLGCVDACREGAARCDGVRVQRCRKDDFSDCMVWGELESCGEDSHCDVERGECVPLCADECREGQTECVGEDYRVCGQFDGDACLEYGEVTGCGTDSVCRAETQACQEVSCGTSCIPGARICSEDGLSVWVCRARPGGGCFDYEIERQCDAGFVCDEDGEDAQCVKGAFEEEVCEVGMARCTPDGMSVETCVANDFGNAWEFRACGEGMVCNAGACGKTCQDMCEEGARQCSGKSGTQVCQMASSGCTVWADDAPCKTAQYCDGGACRYYCGDDCEPWSIVIIPDTQNYTRYDKMSTSTPYHKQMNWIVKNKNTSKIPNLKMVIHMGDITNDNTDIQWKIARDAQDILKKAGVPFTVVNGNHDYKVRGKIGGRSKSKFSEYFPESYLKTLPGYGGIYARHNSYFNFRAGNQDYMVLNLEYYPRQQTLCWANDLLRKAEHLNKKVIIATHSNVSHDAKYTGHSRVTDVANGASGSELWKGLTARHSNIIMALSGHVGDSERREDKGYNGNLVEQILTDYQFEAPCAASKVGQCTNHCAHVKDAGNGWLRIATFYPKENRVKVTTTSVLSGNKNVFSAEGKDQFFCSPLDKGGDNWYPKNPADAVHQYEFTFDFTTPRKNVYKDKGYLGFARRTINDNGTGDQIHSSVAGISDGHFVVVWEDDSSDADGFRSDGKNNAHDIYARIMNPGGCNVSGNAQIIVNTDTAGHQSDPDVAMDKDGNFVVVWTDDTDNNGATQVYMRGFHADGSERFARKTVNQVGTRDQYQARVAMAPDGEFAVSWTDTRAAKEKPQIWVRGFHADGSQAFAERAVADEVAGTRVKSDIFMDKLHRIVVVWEDDGDGNGSTQAKFRILNADGTSKTGVKTANTKARGNQNGPSVGGKQDGSKFIISWTDIETSAKAPYHIMARTFDQNGDQVDADFTLSAASAKNQNSQACMNNAGNAMVSWYDPASGNVMMRKFKGGVLSDAPARVNQPDNAGTGYKGHAYQPAIACLPDAEYAIISYSDDADNNGYHEIYGVGLSM